MLYNTYLIDTFHVERLALRLTMFIILKHIVNFKLWLLEVKLKIFLMKARIVVYLFVFDLLPEKSTYRVKVKVKVWWLVHYSLYKFWVLIFNWIGDRIQAQFDFILQHMPSFYRLIESLRLSIGWSSSFADVNSSANDQDPEFSFFLISTVEHHFIVAGSLNFEGEFIR